MSYFATASGRTIDLKRLSPEDIHLGDIAHHLTKICRFGGAMALGSHYSVARHSLNLAYYAIDNKLKPNIIKACLMHDASEAYLGDIVTGLKGILIDYKYNQLETTVQEMIADKYDIDIYTTESIVKEFDTRIVLDEAASFMPHFYDIYKAQLIGYEPLDIIVREDSSLALTKIEFLHLCESFDIKERS